MIRAIRRAIALFRIRSLEIQAQAQSDAIASVSDGDLYQDISAARRITSKELASARANYTALLPVGQRKTWSIV